MPSNSKGFLLKIYLQQRVGEEGGSIRCRASSGEPTQEAPEKQGKVEEKVMMVQMVDSDMKGGEVDHVNEVKRDTKVPESSSSFSFCLHRLPIV